MSTLAKRMIAIETADRFAYELAMRLARLARAEPEAVAAAGIAVCEALNAGHVCVDLNHVSTQVREWWGADLPAPSRWRTRLLASGIAVAPGGYAPLIVDERGRVYLHRYWRYEKDLADSLLQRAREPIEAVDDVALGRELDRWFEPVNGEPHSGEQRVAAAIAVLKRFAVITGGPGSGKTTTAARLLGVIVALARDRSVRIMLAAPTGKAAGRLAQAIRAAKEALRMPPELAALIPERATTIHRLLGPRRGEASFRHDADALLAVDVVLIDEASMVDLALMAKLVSAMPSAARLILLGDKDQLTSVEAGAVMASLTSGPRGYSPEFAERLARVCGVRAKSFDDGSRKAPGSVLPLSDCVAVLEQSRRFDSSSAIGALARATLAGDTDAALKVLSANALMLSPGADSSEVFASVAEAGFVAYVAAVRAGDPAMSIMDALARFRVLCVHREGARGVAPINRRIEVLLRRSLAGANQGDWYSGRAVVITRNDYRLRLFNGDVGVALPDFEAGGALRVFFEDRDGGVRAIAPARLPAWELAFAMTVHKSQGAEFDRVLLVLPETASPLVTRELLYTAITRARSEVRVFGEARVFGAGVAVGQARDSGLAERLWT